MILKSSPKPLSQDTKRFKNVYKRGCALPSAVDKINRQIDKYQN